MSGIQITAVVVVGIVLFDVVALAVLCAAKYRREIRLLVARACGLHQDRGGSGPAPLYGVRAAQSGVSSGESAEDLCEYSEYPTFTEGMLIGKRK